MLGTAQLPPERIIAHRDRMPPEDRRDPRVHVVAGPPARKASAAAAAAVTETPIARQHDQLAKPHVPEAATPQVDRPPLRNPLDLRALVGRRDKRDSSEAALSWARELGLRIETTGMTATDVVAWAESRNLLGSKTDVPAPGNLLLFERTVTDDELDLIAIVVERDARGVTELVYLAGGVVRRGFVDITRPALRRDGTGAIVNTFLRHGKRWPPSGTHYLAGELLAHVIRTH